MTASLALSAALTARGLSATPSPSRSTERNTPVVRSKVFCTETTGNSDTFRGRGERLDPHLASGMAPTLGPVRLMFGIDSESSPTDKKANGNFVARFHGCWSVERVGEIRDTFNITEPDCAEPTRGVRRRNQWMLVKVIVALQLEPRDKCDLSGGDNLGRRAPSLKLGAVALSASL